jgi:hypothetical protein
MLHALPFTTFDEAAALGLEEGDDLQVADAGRDVARHGRRQRLHHRVGELIARAEAGRWWGRGRSGWPGTPWAPRW